MSNDVIIVDNNFIGASKEIFQYGKKLSSAVREFANILDYVVQEAVLDQKIRERLISMKEQIEPMDFDIEAHTEKVQKILKDFIAEIDEADQFLY